MELIYFSKNLKILPKSSKVLQKPSKTYKQVLAKYYWVLLVLRRCGRQNLLLHNKKPKVAGLFYWEIYYVLRYWINKDKFSTTSSSSSRSLAYKISQKKLCIFYIFIMNKYIITIIHHRRPTHAIHKNQSTMLHLSYYYRSWLLSKKIALKLFFAICKSILKRNIFKNVWYIDFLIKWSQSLIYKIICIYTRQLFQIYNPIITHNIFYAKRIQCFTVYQLFKASNFTKSNKFIYGFKINEITIFSSYDGLEKVEAINLGSQMIYDSEFTNNLVLEYWFYGMKAIKCKGLNKIWINCI